MWPISNEKTINKSQFLDDKDLGIIKLGLYRNYYNYTHLSIRKYAWNEWKSRKPQKRNKKYILKKRKLYKFKV